MREICALLRISGEGRTIVSELLGEITGAFGEQIERRRREPSRREDRQRLERLRREIVNAQHFLKRPTGPAGRVAFRAAGRMLGPLISASWLRARFPGEPLTPVPNYWPNDDFRDDGRDPARSIEIDDLSLQDRIRFAETQAPRVLSAILDHLIKSIDQAYGRIVHLPGGRKPLEIRRFMLAALAELWHRIGRRPTTGARSQFGAFCEAIFEAMGWPTDGVNPALGDAIALWRTLYRRPTESVRLGTKSAQVSHIPRK
jgi:hypothetical protein